MTITKSNINRILGNLLSYVEIAQSNITSPSLSPLDNGGFKYSFEIDVFKDTPLARLEKLSQKMHDKEIGSPYFMYATPVKPLLGEIRTASSDVKTSVSVNSLDINVTKAFSKAFADSGCEVFISNRDFTQSKYFLGVKFPESHPISKELKDIFSLDHTNAAAHLQYNSALLREILLEAFESIMHLYAEVLYQNASIVNLSINVKDSFAMNSSISLNGSVSNVSIGSTDKISSSLKKLMANMDSAMNAAASITKYTFIEPSFQKIFRLLDSEKVFADINTL